MKKILDLFKKKEKKIEYEVVKSRSGLPMFDLPLPDCDHGLTWSHHRDNFG